MDILNSRIQAVKRRLEREITQLEIEIAKVSLAQAAAATSAAELPSWEISRVSHADDTLSLDSFRTADTPRNFSRRFDTQSINSSPDFSRHVQASHIPKHQVVDVLPIQPLKMPFPQFLRENIEMWFWTLEKWFIGANVVDDDRRFSAVLLALPIATVAVFKEQFDNPPHSNKYLFAKDLIVRHFSKNHFQQIKALVEHVELGDTKPSELYAQMRQIAGDSISHTTLKGLWIMRLPEQWRPSLSLASDDPLEFLQAADIMHQVMPKSSLCKIDAVAGAGAIVSDDDLTSQQICAFSKKKPFKKFNYKKKKSSSDSSHHADSELCFYHSQYGNKAHKCIKPCSWKHKADNNDS